MCTKFCWKCSRCSRVLNYFYLSPLPTRAPRDILPLLLLFRVVSNMCTKFYWNCFRCSRVLNYFFFSLIPTVAPRGARKARAHNGLLCHAWLWRTACTWLKIVEPLTRRHVSIGRTHPRDVWIWLQQSAGWITSHDMKEVCHKHLLMVKPSPSLDSVWLDSASWHEPSSRLPDWITSRHEGLSRALDDGDTKVATWLSLNGFSLVTWG